MAEPPDIDWVGTVSHLPPFLQGIAVLGGGAAIGVLLTKKFFERLRAEPNDKLLAVGEPTSFADMAPVRDLVKNVDQMNMQLMKNELQMSNLVATFQTYIEQMSRIADIAGEIMMDLKQERARHEDEEQRKLDRQAGYEDAMEEIKRKRRRRRAQVAKSKGVAQT